MSADFKVYGYRWAVLAVFMFVNLTIQILWISFAPITGPAAAFYGVSELQIGLLSMVFMLAFIPLSIPVSWIIDRFGFRVAVDIGVVLMGAFGLLRGLAGSSYPLVLLATIGIAVSQPFLLNAWSTVPAKWFPARERATALGLVTLSNLVGTALGMILTPMMIEGMSIPTVQLAFGAVSAVSAAAFLFLAREKPPTPPCAPGMEGRALMLEGLRHALSNGSFWLFLAISFIAMGIFNGLNTWIEAIVRPRGFSPTFAGSLGALMLGGGLVGAIVLPALSDRGGRRRGFLLFALLGAIPGLLGLAFAGSGPLLAASAFALGFFIVSIMPIGLQYAAEITYPTPEGTSNGLIQLFGQGAVVFVYIMEAMKTKAGSFTPSLLLGVGLLALSAAATRLMRDPLRLDAERSAEAKSAVPGVA
ncbi:MAG: MFS transporter [Treponema sp.]|nr:MFS transporter [Treponema sp.]